MWSLGELLRAGLHPLGAQQLAGVVGHAAGRHHLEVLDARLLQGLVGGDVADEHLGQADLGVDAVDRRRPPADAGRRRPARSSWPAVGQHAGQVGRHRGLALALVGAGDHHAADRVVDVDEPEVGAQLAEGLGRGPAVGEVDALGLTAVEVLDVGHDGQHRGLDQLLHLLDRAQLAVEVHADERREVAEQDADEPADGRGCGCSSGVNGAAGRLALLHRLQPHQAAVAVPCGSDLSLGLHATTAVASTPGLRQRLRGLRGAGVAGDDDRGRDRVGAPAQADHGRRRCRGPRPPRHGPRSRRRRRRRCRPSSAPGPGRRCISPTLDEPTEIWAVAVLAYITGRVRVHTNAAIRTREETMKISRSWPASAGRSREVSRDPQLESRASARVFPRTVTVSASPHGQFGPCAGRVPGSAAQRVGEGAGVALAPAWPGHHGGVAGLRMLPSSTITVGTSERLRVAEVAAYVETVAAGDVRRPGQPAVAAARPGSPAPAGARSGRCRGSTAPGRQARSRGTRGRRGEGAVGVDADLEVGVRLALPARPRSSTHGPQRSCRLLCRVIRTVRAERLQPVSQPERDVPGEARLGIAAVGGRSGGVAGLAEAAGRHQPADPSREVLVAELVARVDDDHPARRGAAARSTPLVVPRRRTPRRAGADAGDRGGDRRHQPASTPAPDATGHS